jgi:hypothetical protein
MTGPLRTCFKSSCAVNLYHFTADNQHTCQMWRYGAPPEVVTSISGVLPHCLCMETKYSLTSLIIDSSGFGPLAHIHFEHSGGAFTQKFLSDSTSRSAALFIEYVVSFGQFVIQL